MNITLKKSIFALLVSTTLWGCVNSSSVVRLKDLSGQDCIAEQVELYDHVLFDTDKSFIRPNEKAELDEFIAKLKAINNSGKQNITGLKLTGYTDFRNTEAYNLALSKRRVKSVEKYLIDHGVSIDIISTFAEGEANPVGNNSTKEGRQKNRRVEIQAIGIK